MAYTGKPENTDVAENPQYAPPMQAPPGGSLAGSDFPMREAPGGLTEAPAPGDGEDRDPNLSDFMMQVIELNASDLHMTAGLPPMMRLNGVLKPIRGYRKLFPQDMQELIYAILTQKQREIFEDKLELDLSYQLPGKARFRVNVFRQRDALGAVMRLIPFGIKSVEDLGLPPQVSNFSRLRRGLVLVTGVTGSGKSTTLAALIDEINRDREDHIMTVEDPIEFLHRHGRSIVNQREVGTDTRSFQDALRHALRQDPDVILVGEMRDLETISTALTAAETGHLVFATLHTQDAPQSVDRVIDVFPPHQQQQVRMQLSIALQGIVTQQLIPTADGSSRIVASEVLVPTPAIRNLIREGKTHQIYSAIQTSGSTGMQTMDGNLAQLVRSGKITRTIAEQRASVPEELKRLLGGTESMSASNQNTVPVRVA